jgi:probable HAF family extracellular repeat protein
MRWTSPGRLLLLLALASVVFGPSSLTAGPLPAEPPYDVVDLGVLDPTFPQTVPAAINALGEVAGYSYVALPPYGGWSPRAVLWRNGSLLDLGLPPGILSNEARSVNDSGEVAVIGQKAQGGAAPLLFADRDGDGTKEWSRVETPNDYAGYAYGINNAGRVVGMYGGYNRAFFLDSHVPGASLVDLHTLLDAFLPKNPILYASGAIAVNEPGDVLVDYYNGNGDQTAIFRQGTTTPQLLNPPGYESFRPVAFNASGQVVGLASRQEQNTNVTHAVVYDGSTLTKIEIPASTWIPQPKGIDGSGRVVGYYYANNATLCPFLYENGQATDLNDLLPPGSGWTLREANAINDAGEIVGTGRQDGVGEGRGFLLTHLTPARRIDNLIAMVEGFELPKGIANSFVTKLEHALAALEAGDTATACSELQAFVNHAEAQAGKKLTVEQAGQVIDAANAIRAVLGCS